MRDRAGDDTGKGVPNGFSAAPVDGVGDPFTIVEPPLGSTVRPEPTAETILPGRPVKKPTALEIPLGMSVVKKLIRGLMKPL